MLERSPCPGSVRASWVRIPPVAAFLERCLINKIFIHAIELLYKLNFRSQKFNLKKRIL